MLSVNNSRKQLVTAAMGFLRLYEKLIDALVTDYIMTRPDRQIHTLYIPLGHADRDKMFRVWFYFPSRVVGILYQIVPADACNPYLDTEPVDNCQLVPLVYHDSCWRDSWGNFLWKNADVITDRLTLRPFMWTGLNEDTERLFKTTLRREPV